MVQLHIKKGDESAFLYQVPVATSLSEIVPKVAQLYNDRKRLERLIAGELNPQNDIRASLFSLQHLFRNFSY